MAGGGCVAAAGSLGSKPPITTKYGFRASALLYLTGSSFARASCNEAAGHKCGGDRWMVVVVWCDAAIAVDVAFAGCAPS